MWLPGHTFVTLDLKAILHLLFEDSKNRSQILLPRLFWYLSPLPFFFSTTKQQISTFVLLVTFVGEHEFAAISYGLGFAFLR